MEKSLTSYSTLTLGDTIQINYKQNIYKFDITKVEPSIIQSTAPPAINIIECDIKIDFKEPRDYKQWKMQNENENENDIDSLHESISRSLSISSPNAISGDDRSRDSKEEFESSDYSNDDPVASPDYFEELYGMNKRVGTPDYQKNKSNEENNKPILQFW